MTRAAVAPDRAAAAVAHEAAPDRDHDLAADDQDRDHAAVVVGTRAHDHAQDLVHDRDHDKRSCMDEIRASLKKDNTLPSFFTKPCFTPYISPAATEKNLNKKKRHMC